MNILSRLRAMMHLGASARGLAEVSRQRVIEADDAARLLRLGDIDGQTGRAQAFAAELDKRVRTFRA